MDELEKILKRYKYKISFEAVHQKKDIEKYSKKRDAVQITKHLTIWTRSGLVVGRLYDVTSKSKSLTKTHIKTVKFFLKNYQIPYADEIIAGLDELC